mgnify:CR=1 FL=1
MARFKTKPTFVEATQWFKPGDHEKVIRYSDTDGDQNDWRNVVLYNGRPLDVSPDDWIIHNSSGTFVPCKPEEFEKLYEPAE